MVPFFYQPVSPVGVDTRQLKQITAFRGTVSLAGRGDRLEASSELAVSLKPDYRKEMLELLDERGWPHADKAQLLVFMEGVIHLTEGESSREYEEWESALERAKEAGRIYVSIMERKGIEKDRTEGIQLGEARGIRLGREETARNLLRMGLDLTKIAEVTGLPMEEIQVLKKTGQV